MIRRSFVVIGIVSVLLLALFSVVYAQDAGPQAVEATLGTAFTYQGQLKDNGNPVNASCDFQLYLYDSLAGTGQIGSVANRPGIQVMNGYFTITNLDFGSTAFSGEARWLRIDVRCPAGGGGYTTLTPRQALTPAPYALALPGLYTLQNATSPNFIGGYSGNFISSTVFGSVIGGGGSVAQGLNRAQADYATIGGGSGNTARADYATIGGGEHISVTGRASTVAGGSWITVTGDYAVVNGGARHVVMGDYATVGGGLRNTAESAYTTIAGGTGNTAHYPYATVGGGSSNIAQENHATVVGGVFNEALADYAFIGGGSSNTASGYYSTIPGGSDNVAIGSYSFAAGSRAQSNHNGTFV